MALKMHLRWKNPDSTLDLNRRFKDVFGKGFVIGADLVPDGGSLDVDITAFVLVNNDGTVVTSDADITLTAIDGNINYFVVRAKYVDLDSPILSVELLDQASYLGDPDIAWLHVVGVADLSSGGPYATVPLSTIFYDDRDVVDQQGRSSWRDPVADAASLPVGPASFNKEGDIRLALAEGAIFRWDGGAWGGFDPVALTAHRDDEHTNGITAGSSATTLQPDISGTDITVAAVAGTSSYTVDGLRLTAPGAPTVIPAAGVGAVRGLIQCAFDSTGADVTNFRVSKDADPLDIGYAQIVNISDGHPLGSFALLYDLGGKTLSWAAGKPVSVLSGTSFRLKDSTGANYIDILLSGTAPVGSVSDNYTVNASLKDDEHLLVGYWFWDGSTTLILGADKRTFGNLGFEEMSDDFKDTVLYPYWQDTRNRAAATTPTTITGRGGSWFSGGAYSVISGLTVRIEGPIVAYVDGKRFVVDGSYTGLSMTPSMTNYIYVDNEGTLQVSTVNPSTLGGNYALLHRVVAGGASISSALDLRTSETLVSETMSFSHSPRNNYVVLTKDGVAAGFSLAIDDLDAGDVRAVGTVSSENGLFTDAGSGTGVQFGDTNTTPATINLAGGPLAEDLNLTNRMVGASTVSILGALRAAEEARQHKLGIITGCEISSPAGSTVVQINAGRFVDPKGRVITIESPLSVDVDALAPSDGVNVVYWNSTTDAFDVERVSTGVKNEDMPFAIVTLTAGVIYSLVDITLKATGVHSSNRALTVGNDGAVGAQFPSNFPTPYHALAYLVCFDENDSGFSHYGPRTIEIVGRVTINTTPDLAGTVSITMTTTALTGSGTRFLTDFQPGDWIQIGNDEGEVVSVLTDTSMTLANPWVAATKSGDTYGRYAAAGPSAWTFDADGPIFTGLGDDRLRNIRVIGTATDDEKPTIFWGVVGGDGVNTMPAKPLWDFGALGAEMSDWSMRDFRMLYNGSSFAVAGDHSVCMLKDPPPGFLGSRLTLDGGVDISHFVYWETQPVLGGHREGAGIETDGATVFDQCMFVAGESGAFSANTAAFRMDSAAMFGHLVLRDCAIGGNGDVAYAFDISSFTADPNIHVIGGQISDVLTAIFRHEDVGGQNRAKFDAMKILDGVKLSSLGASCKVTPATIFTPIGSEYGPSVVMNNCEIQSNLDLNGTSMATACWATNGVTITIPDHVSLHNCDFDEDAVRSGTPRSELSNSGRLKLGTPLANTAAPQDNTAYANSMVAAHGVLTTVGSGGGVGTTFTLGTESFNIDTPTSYSSGGDDIRVFFRNSMRNAGFTVLANVEDATGALGYYATVGARDSTFFNLDVFNSAGTHINLATTAGIIINVVVIGATA